MHCNPHMIRILSRVVCPRWTCCGMPNKQNTNTRAWRRLIFTLRWKSLSTGEMKHYKSLCQWGLMPKLPSRSGLTRDSLLYIQITKRLQERFLHPHPILTQTFRSISNIKHVYKWGRNSKMRQVGDTLTFANIPDMQTLLLSAACVNREIWRNSWSGLNPWRSS